MRTGRDDAAITNVISFKASASKECAFDKSLAKIPLDKETTPADLAPLPEILALLTALPPTQAPAEVWLKLPPSCAVDDGAVTCVRASSPAAPRPAGVLSSPIGNAWPGANHTRATVAHAIVSERPSGLRTTTPSSGSIDVTQPGMTWPSVSDTPSAGGSGAPGSAA